MARPASSTSVNSGSTEGEDQGPDARLEFGSLSSFPTFFEGVFESDVSSPSLSIFVHTDVTSMSQRTLIFLDPSSHTTALGWSLRNVLFYLSSIYSVTSINLISLRSTAHSRQGIISLSSLPTASSSAPLVKPSVVGWERSDLTGKLQPKLADLGPLLDPKILADSAVDLNLQLMKWRIMPELDLEKVKRTRVLLLGAGTLGCYVARTLMVSF